MKVKRFAGYSSYNTYESFDNSTLKGWIYSINGGERGRSSWQGYKKRSWQTENLALRSVTCHIGWRWTQRFFSSIRL